MKSVAIEAKEPNNRTIKGKELKAQNFHNFPTIYLCSVIVLCFPLNMFENKNNMARWKGKLKAKNWKICSLIFVGYFDNVIVCTAHKYERNKI